MRTKKECSKMNKVKIEVIEVRGGECPLGYKVGDKFQVKGPAVPSGMCAWAWQSIFPVVTTLRFKGIIPWEEDQKKLFLVVLM